MATDCPLLTTAFLINSDNRHFGITVHNQEVAGVVRKVNILYVLSSAFAVFDLFV
jgi:hypothetical protein